MPPQRLFFLHSFQQHVTDHSLHALIVVRYQTEALNTFSSNQKGDFSATRVEVLKIYSTPEPDASRWRKKTRLKNNVSLAYHGI